jgi:hypothetical protein
MVVLLSENEKLILSGSKKALIPEKFHRFIPHSNEAIIQTAKEYWLIQDVFFRKEST